MAEKEKEIKEAIETLEDISSDEAKERIAELRQKYIMDTKSQLRTAEEKGLKEGMQKRSIEIAQRLKQEDISIDIIEKVTGLTKKEIEEI